jgi:hypothetical protein
MADWVGDCVMIRTAPVKQPPAAVRVLTKDKVWIIRFGSDSAEQVSGQLRSVLGLANGNEAFNQRMGLTFYASPDLYAVQGWSSRVRQIIHPHELCLFCLLGFLVAEVEGRLHYRIESGDLKTLHVFLVAEAVIPRNTFLKEWLEVLEQIVPFAVFGEINTPEEDPLSRSQKPHRRSPLPVSQRAVRPAHTGLQRQVTPALKAPRADERTILRLINECFREKNRDAAANSVVGAVWARPTGGPALLDHGVDPRHQSDG